MKNITDSRLRLMSSLYLLKTRWVIIETMSIQVHVRLFFSSLLSCSRVCSFRYGLREMNEGYFLGVIARPRGKNERELLAKSRRRLTTERFIHVSYDFPRKRLKINGRIAICRHKKNIVYIKNLK